MGHQPLSEEDRRLLERVKASKVKARAAARARSEREKAKGLRELSARVPAAHYAQIRGFLAAFTEKYLAAQRANASLPEVETDQMTNMLRGIVEQTEFEMPAQVSPEPAEPDDHVIED